MESTEMKLKFCTFKIRYIYGYMVSINAIIILQLETHQMRNATCYAEMIFTKRIVIGGGLTKLEPHIFFYQQE
jgi:hypothetical protein